MPASILMITEVLIANGEVDQAIAQWSRLRSETDSESTLFRSTVDNALLELTALTDISQLDKERESFDRLFTDLAPHVQSDFRRQIVEFVEAPKTTDAAIPSTQYLQLRHIEVPPAVYSEYREWRERTIFDVVRRADEVEVFLAYHSLLSTEPGVMFVSGFDTDPDRYAEVFATDEYKEIVRQAGSKYIATGERGLYTKIYQRVDNS